MDRRELAGAAVVFVLLLLYAIINPFYTADNIHRLYDAEWIEGKTREEIVEKYGEFDREYTLDTGEDVGAWYVNYDNGPLDASYIHDTYFVYFDENDVALRSEFRQTSIGG